MSPHHSPNDSQTADQEYLSRDYVSVFERAGGTYKVQGSPPIGRMRWDCMEFWITRIDLPIHAQVAYHVYYFGRRFDNTPIAAVTEQLDAIEFGTGKECGVEPAFVDGPCETNHDGVCEMCRIADPLNATSMKYDSLVQEAEKKLASAREAFASGKRFTLYVKGPVHDNCPPTCETCQSGFNKLSLKERYREVEQHSKGYPTDRATDKLFEKHGFGFVDEVEVIQTEHWVENREDELTQAQELRRLFNLAKASHAQAVKESAASARHALAKTAKTSRDAGKGSTGV